MCQHSYKGIVLYTRRIIWKWYVRQNQEPGQGHAYQRNTFIGWMTFQLQLLLATWLDKHTQTIRLHVETMFSAQISFGTVNWHLGICIEPSVNHDLQSTQKFANTSFKKIAPMPTTSNIWRKNFGWNRSHHLCNARFLGCTNTYWNWNVEKIKERSKPERFTHVSNASKDEINWKYRKLILQKHLAFEPLRKCDAARCPGDVKASLIGRLQNGKRCSERRAVR